MLFLPQNCSRRIGLYLGIAAHWPHGFDTNAVAVDFLSWLVDFIVLLCYIDYCDEMNSFFIRGHRNL